MTFDVGSPGVFEKLIVETDMKVSDIAIQAGFSSQTYFNRLFKRVHGTSPREYRYLARTETAVKFIFR